MDESETKEKGLFFMNGVFKKILSFAMLTVVFVLFLSCSPVKFSSSSNQPTAPETPADPTPTGQGGGGTSSKDVETTYTVTSKQNKVDILLIVDNSSSMNADNLKLADKLNQFVGQLENSSIDWQMCLTVTTYIPAGSTNYWGMSVNWADYTGTQSWVLKKGTANLSTIFRNTIANNLATGSANTNDERAIKAGYWHVSYKDYNNCYRPDAALAYIIISDEDERSIGGNSSLKYYSDELKTLEQDDLPSILLEKVKSSLGSSIRFRANSIVVKSADSTCLKIQDDQGTKAHYGKMYEELATLTGGGIGSICDNDYTSSLSYFNDIINDSLGSMPLECNPESNNVSVTITPANNSISSSVQGQSLVFTPSVPAGSTIVAKYKCSLTTSNLKRAPNATNNNSDSKVLQEPSFLTKLYTWIIEPLLQFFN